MIVSERTERCRSDMRILSRDGLSYASVPCTQQKGRSQTSSQGSHECVLVSIMRQSLSHRFCLITAVTDLKSPVNGRLGTREVKESPQGHKGTKRQTAAGTRIGPTPVPLLLLLTTVASITPWAQGSGVPLP